MDISCLKAGDKAVVCEIKGGSKNLRQKLAVFGVLPNSYIEIVRKAPLGGSLQIKLPSGFAFCLGNKEAQCISIAKI